MLPSRRGAAVIVVTISVVTLSVLSGCGHPPAEDAAKSAVSQNLPFDRRPHAGAISPSQSLIPSSTRLPEGTAISIRLQGALSSESSHAGDTFKAITDQPVVVDGLTVVAEGTPATGRVLEAKPSARSAGGPREAGYLRIVLVSLNVGGRVVAIETSSIFAKGGPREGRAPATGGKHKDVVFAINRQLDFRLAQAVDLQ